ncbi:MAG: Gfo/Idh/MocA family protein [Bacillota bacterium]
MKTVTVALIGAGGRGMSYTNFALKNPEQLQCVAVAEPDPERRERVKKLHGISVENTFSSWTEILDRPRLADAVFICTQDRMHFEPAMKAMGRGYHILLEKPMSTTPQECALIGEQAEKNGRILLICHVLRYTGFFSALKRLLDEGRIGRLMAIQHNENVGFWHQAHSYVRGNWRNSNGSSPMILAKSCHDMDIMLWLAGADCLYISSFGSLTHFKPENAPPGAPKRCTDGCPAEKGCPYSALKIYINDNTSWPVDVITSDFSLEGRLKALREGPYGRCVYYCDNNVVDHQVVNIEFANEVTAAFTMSAFTGGGRTIKLMGTHGEMRGYMEKNEIEIINFRDSSTELINTSGNDSGYGHGGGDWGIMREFTRLVQKGGTEQGLTSATVSVQSHLMAFAAEKSRLEKKVINMTEYAREIKESDRR